MKDNMYYYYSNYVVYVLIYVIMWITEIILNAKFMSDSIHMYLYGLKCIFILNSWYCWTLFRRFTMFFVVRIRYQFRSKANIRITFDYCMYRHLIIKPNNVKNRFITNLLYYPRRDSTPHYTCLKQVIIFLPKLDS